MAHLRQQLIPRLMKAAVMVLAVIFFGLGVASPAIAFGSNPTEDTVQMNELQRTSEEAVKAEPRDQQQVRKQARKGPNEVQGDADLDKMQSDDSSEATAVSKQVESALKKVTP
ncbi:MAG TPA: hypothetical protein V6D02_07430 [Candidatus Obscuribacterales bacterium]